MNLDMSQLIAVIGLVLLSMVSITLLTSKSGNSIDDNDCLGSEVGEYNGFDDMLKRHSDLKP